MDFFKVLSILTSCLEVLFFGGVIYGFSSLQYVLEQEGYFEYLCNNSTEHGLPIINIIKENISTVIICGKQQASFNLAFTIGVSFFYVISFPWGVVLDRYETWVFRTIITILYTLSYLLLIFSKPSTSYLLIVILFLLGVSGMGTFMSNV